MLNKGKYGVTAKATIYVEVSAYSKEEAYEKFQDLPISALNLGDAGIEVEEIELVEDEQEEY